MRTDDVDQDLVVTETVRRTYLVSPRQWRHGWELHIDGVGVTQARTKDEAERMARDFIALDLDVDPRSFDVTIDWEDSTT